ncbi:TenA family transcriptional regulator [Thiohalorhabdus methylotrophus]|uniref:TenA family transcriptional regulator n=1 Tax=Thiohalorhabdus methylotrophus TaxID=3242694 RepID=A0ABV4TU95_9GAMM
MAFYQRFYDATLEQRTELREMPGLQHLVTEGLAKEEYLGFLTQLYHMVWHFCPTMAAAASRMGEDRRELRYALYHDIEEEKGHEEWVLSDVRDLGGDPEAVRSSTPSPELQALIGYNYYAVERVSPCAVFGMIYVLEETAADLASRAADALAARLGLEPPEGLSFLSSHGDMDVEHVAELRELLDGIEAPVDQEAIIEAARVNYRLFGGLFRA